MKMKFKRINTTLLGTDPLMAYSRVVKKRFASEDANVDFQYVAGSIYEPAVA
jgi:hypothetical protein